MKKKVKVYWGRIAIFVLSVVGTIALIALILSLLFPEKPAEPDPAPSYVKKSFLKSNPYSRPGDPLKKVNNIVIHYVANPGTSAEANRNYFNNLANSASNPDGVKASAHFIVGLSGEVIQCIPLSEIAYANAPRNGDTVSIEVCHPDETGKFAPETEDALVRLTADLLNEYGLTSSDVIRHYDVSGKACPKYYVENEEAWKSLLQKIQALQEETE